MKTRLNVLILATAVAATFAVGMTASGSNAADVPAPSAEAPAMIDHIPAAAHPADGISDPSFILL